MPLLLTPAAPLTTTCGLLAPSLYLLIDSYTYVRKTRYAQFEAGYYFDEAASLPGSGMAQLPVNLPRGFAFQIEPGQLEAVGDVMPVLEAYARLQLAALLPEATFQEVA